MTGIDFKWIHQFEGHIGRPYFPGNVRSTIPNHSGLTLDPGADLGHIDRALFERLYLPIIGESGIKTLRPFYGLKGHRCFEISRRNDVSAIRVSREQATEVFPHICLPYWEIAVRRFKGLDQAPNPVKTAMLSLVYNRGPRNPHLAGLIPLIQAGDWSALGTAISRMQQDHALPGIRTRRRAEGALCKTASNLLEERVSSAVEVSRMEIKPPDFHQVIVANHLESKWRTL